MSLPKLKHQVVNSVDLGKLLKEFSITQLCSIFNVTPGYIYKVQNLQRIEAEKNYKTNVYNSDDEMKLGRKGAWMQSKQRIEFQQWQKANELKNEEI